MNWFVIILLSLLGFLMGLLSVKGLTKGIEPYLWIILGIFCALVLSKNQIPKFFLSAFLIGLAWGILNSIAQVTFFQTYLAHNPQAVEGFQKVPAKINRSALVLLAGTGIGTVTGLVLGGLTWIGKKLLH
jgi:hypothetical protein